LQGGVGIVEQVEELSLAMKVLGAVEAVDGTTTEEQGGQRRGHGTRAPDEPGVVETAYGGGTAHDQGIVPEELDRADRRIAGPPPSVRDRVVAVPEQVCGEIASHP